MSLNIIAYDFGSEVWLNNELNTISPNANHNLTTADQYRFLVQILSEPWLLASLTLPESSSIEPLHLIGHVIHVDLLSKREVIFRLDDEICSALMMSYLEINKIESNEARVHFRSYCIDTSERQLYSQMWVCSKDLSKMVEVNFEGKSKVIHDVFMTTLSQTLSLGRKGGRSASVRMRPYLQALSESQLGSHPQAEYIGYCVTDKFHNYRLISRIFQPWSFFLNMKVSSIFFCFSMEIVLLNHSKERDKNWISR